MSVCRGCLCVFVRVCVFKMYALKNTNISVFYMMRVTSTVLFNREILLKKSCSPALFKSFQSLLEKSSPDTACCFQN